MSVPTGAVMAFACYPDQLPEGWLPCHGQAVLRAEYPELFAVIGLLRPGAGNGENFLLPDLRGRVVIGVAQGGSGSGYVGPAFYPTEVGGNHRHFLTLEQMPRHDHSVRMASDGGVVPGNLQIGYEGPTFGFQSGGPNGGMSPANGRTGETGGGPGGGVGQPFDLLPPYMALTWAIKT